MESHKILAFDPLFNHPLSVRTMSLLFCHLCLGLPGNVSLSIFRLELCKRVSFPLPIRVKFPAHLMAVHLISLIIFGEG